MMQHGYHSCDQAVSYSSNCRQILNAVTHFHYFTGKLEISTQTNIQSSLVTLCLMLW